jgi:hypothetical protein
MPGLDPGIHALKSSMDGWVKPGHDENIALIQLAKAVNRRKNS